ncbi:RNA polymerase sigma-70 factor (sigma-E family) [Jatrophihabitans sp. GAS493]|uniref:SigE family RNA polymerase sigma factor n=1 Tax=Jatrophihabitans sp. GAS493 TaxID=1907575 RepID=UPI000BB77B24|nr:SigE family RNA polymerase sigma factor [Jatrophihabitans sp. GAS493]SOD75172.1 RNA polymerase sigma-70 factor (sigma-E family) [Jatrophihabitans sp. GAS493]
MPDEEAFRAFVQLHGSQLTQTARLLTGSHHGGEDLAQNVLIKLYLKWDQVSAPLAYARKSLVSTHIDSTRRRWWGERPTVELPDLHSVDDASQSTVAKDEIRQLLTGLSPRERAVVVLRYYCDLSERETAEILKMPVGTVKSACARALTQLRVTATIGEGR